MNYTEAKEKATALYHKTGKLSKEDRQLVNELHILVFSEPVATCNCTNVYTDALLRLMLFFKKNDKLNICRYYMQAGSAFMIGGDCYTNYNLTDEAAEELIRTNPLAAKVIHLKAGAEKATESEKKVTTKKAIKK